MEHDTLLLVVPETSETYWDENDIGVFVITADTPTPNRMSVFIQNGQINSRYLSVSPNGQWVIFERKAKGADQATPWISSIDGKQQWPLTTDKHLEVGYWLNDETVMLEEKSDQTGGSIYRSYVQVLNPFTMEGRIAEKFPRMEFPGIGAQFLQYADRTYLIYQDGYDYRLRDIFAQSDQQVLEWLRDDPAGFFDKGVSVFRDGRIVIRVDRSYGLDVSPPMNPEELAGSSSYIQTMRPIVFPQTIMPARAGLFISRERPTGMWVAPRDARRFYWLDYDQGIIRDYCFSEGGPYGTSLDGKFAAFVHMTTPHTQPLPKITFILNLETGYASKLEGYEFIAWAKAGK